jgi:hypothetical protein
MVGAVIGAYDLCMKHFICTGGCEGVSDKPGTCQAKDCPDYGKPLKECDCEDGEHAGIVDSDEEGTM